MKKLFYFAAVAAIAGAFSACTPKEEAEPEVNYTLAFAQSEESEFSINLSSADVETDYIQLDTDAPADKISVACTDDQTWATVSLNDELQLEVTAGATDQEEDRTAEFKIAAGKSELKLIVTQLGSSTEVTLTIEFDGAEYTTEDWPMINAPVEAASYAITVTTNAPRWTAEEMFGAGDGNAYFTLDKTTGRSGDVVTLTTETNTEVSDWGLAGGSVTFTAVGSAEQISVNVMQASAVATE